MKTFGDWVRHFVDTGIANEQNAISLVQAAQLRGEIEVVAEMPSAQDPNFYYRDENGLFHVLEHLQFGIPIYRKAQDGSFYLVYGEVAEHPSSQKPANSLIDWDDEDSLFANTPEKIKAKLEWMNNHWSGDPFAFGGRHPADFIILSPYDIWNHEDEIDDGNFDQFGELARKYAGTKRRGVSDEGGIDQSILHQIRGAHLAVRYAQQLCEGEYDPACFADPALDEYFTFVNGVRVVTADAQNADPDEGGRRLELARATLMVLAQYGALDSGVGLSPIEEFAMMINMHEHSAITDEAAVQYLYDLVLYNILGTKSQKWGVDMPIKQFGLDEMTALFTESGRIKDISLEGMSLMEGWVAEAVAGLTSALWRRVSGGVARDKDFFNLFLTDLAVDSEGNVTWGAYPPVDIKLEPYLGHATVEYIERLRSGQVEYQLSDGRTIRFDPDAIRTFAGSEFLASKNKDVVEQSGRGALDRYIAESVMAGGDQKIQLSYTYTDENGVVVTKTANVPLYSYRFPSYSVGIQSDIYVMEPHQQNFARELAEGVHGTISSEADLIRAICKSEWFKFTQADGTTKCDYCHALNLQCHTDKPTSG